MRKDPAEVFDIDECELDLEYIVDQLADFYEPNEARQWIFAPQKLLDGASAAELIRNGQIDDVLRLIRRQLYT